MESLYKIGLIASEFKTIKIRYRLRMTDGVFTVCDEEPIQQLHGLLHNAFNNFVSHLYDKTSHELQLHTFACHVHKNRRFIRYFTRRNVFITN